MLDITKKVQFTDIEPGQMFYAHNQMWVKITPSGGKCLPDVSRNEGNFGICSFMTHGANENEPELVSPINTNELVIFLQTSVAYQKMEQMEEDEMK